MLAAMHTPSTLPDMTRPATAPPTQAYTTLAHTTRIRPARTARWPLGMLGVSLCYWLSVAQAEVITGTDAEIGLPFWELREPGMSLRLVQRVPDQTRAFFMARGFSRDDVERVADNCVFQTIFKNVAQDASAGALEYDLREWVVSRAGKTGRMQTREYWAAEWSARGIVKPARIAFEWALYPTRQIYNPGDYNWGMSVFGLSPGSRFDLTVVWKQFGKRHTARIEGILCAADASKDADPPVEVP